MVKHELPLNEYNRKMYRSSELNSNNFGSNLSILIFNLLSTSVSVYKV